MKILIVEDNKVSGKLLMQMLSAYGECDLARDGEQGVKLFTEAINSNSPYKLVTLDIMMPVKDGLETLNEIREIEINNGITGLSEAKIIMTTSLSDKKNVLQAFSKQCEAYMTKPINKPILEETLQKMGFEKK